MAFLRPALPEIVSRCVADVRAGLGTSPARVGFARVLGTVMGGISYSLHGHLDWISRQANPLNAEGSALEAWALVWGIRRKPASFATGLLLCTGNPGALVPDGTVFHDAGVEFESEGRAEISPEGHALVGVVCRAPGLTGNREPGGKLSLLTPLAGVDSEATTAEPGIRGGLEIEKDGELRSRLLARIQRPPQGGTLHDYESWALEVPGLTRAWAMPWWLGPGTVGVCVVSDSDSGPAIPGAPKLQELQAYLDARKTATAKVHAFAPVLRPLPLRVRVTPATPTVRLAVEKALREPFRRLAPGETLYASRLAAALVGVEGVQSATLLEPPTDTTPERHEILIPGEITWTV